MNDEKWERLDDALDILTSPRHTFGTDACLLAGFASPRSGELCCDLGSGCGIIPMQFIRFGTRCGEIYAVEISAEACGLFAHTIERYSLGDRIKLVNRDLRDVESLPAAGGIGLVTCNPPYFAAGTGLIASGEARASARHEGEYSCSFTDVCVCAGRLLKYGGRLCVCHRPERLPDVMEAMRRSGIEPKRLRLVQNLPGSPPWLLLIEGKKGGRPSLKIEAPLIIRKSDGGYTDEVYKLYGMMPPEEA